MSTVLGPMTSEPNHASIADSRIDPETTSEPGITSESLPPGIGPHVKLSNTVS